VSVLFVRAQEFLDLLLLSWVWEQGKHEA